MNRPIVWDNAAVQDVESIVRHIAAHHPITANRVGRRILDKPRILQTFPYIGGLFPGMRGIRFLVSKPYVIYYTVHRYDIRIRAVLHGSQLFNRDRLSR